MSWIGEDLEFEKDMLKQQISRTNKDTDPTRYSHLQGQLRVVRSQIATKKKKASSSSSDKKPPTEKKKTTKKQQQPVLPPVPEEKPATSKRKAVETTDEPPAKQAKASAAAVSGDPPAKAPRRLRNPNALVLKPLAMLTKDSTKVAAVGNEPTAEEGVRCRAYVDCHPAMLQMLTGVDADWELEPLEVRMLARIVLRKLSTQANSVKARSEYNS